MWLYYDQCFSIAQYSNRHMPYASLDAWCDGRYTHAKTDGDTLRNALGQVER